MKSSSTPKKWPLFAIAIVIVLVISLSYRSLPNLFSTQASYPSQAWEISTPEEQGIDSTKLAEGLLAIQQKGIAIHSLTIIRHGKMVLDAYFYPYDGKSYHDVASVTKSVTTTLIGIAVDKGQLNLDQQVLSFFPNRTIAHRDARKEAITVRHLLYNASGLDCSAVNNEQTQQQMRASQDWIQFVLDLEPKFEPGTHFSYCSPTMHLLSAILQEATGLTLKEYAKANLFEPLGITQWYWDSDPQGYTRGWGDLALYPQDMARIGYLYLHDGRWGNRQVVSKEWVRQATVKQIDTHQPENYGYGWWMSLDNEEPVFFAAEGANGHRIIVVRDWDLTLVTTDGGYDYDQIVPYLVAAIIDLENPLPANPNGVEQLAAAVEKVAQAPAAKAVPALPSIAAEISGRTFSFEPNQVGLEWLRLDIKVGSPTADFQVYVPGESGLRELVVGLDGLYRWNEIGRPTLSRGKWIDEFTFLIDFNEGPGKSIILFKMKFSGDQVELNMTSYDSLISLTLTGQAVR